MSRKITDLTEEEIKQVVEDIFDPKEIRDIRTRQLLTTYVNT